MADLLNTTIIGDLKVNKIRKSTGDVIVDTTTTSLNGYSIRRILNQVHSGTVLTGAVRREYVIIHTFPTLTGFKAGSIIELSYHIPCRNDNEGWGGIFIEPQVRINTGAWFSLGGTGYDLMYLQARYISSYFNSNMFDPNQSADFSLQFRFYAAPHDGAVTINGSHAIGTRSDAAGVPDMNGDNSNQHYMNIKVQELTKLSG